MGVSWLFLLLGMVLVVEGLVLALIPGRMEDMLAFIARTPLRPAAPSGFALWLWGCWSSGSPACWPPECAGRKTAQKTARLTVILSLVYAVALNIPGPRRNMQYQP